MEMGPNIHFGANALVSPGKTYGIPRRRTGQLHSVEQLVCPPGHSDGVDGASGEETPGLWGNYELWTGIELRLLPLLVCGPFQPVGHLDIFLPGVSGTSGQPEKPNVGTDPFR